MNSVLKFLIDMGNLKKLPRTGWMLRGINGCESVAAHNYRVSLICMLFCDQIAGADFEKTLKIALLHEIGETRLGDIPSPIGNLINKSELEKRIADDILAEHGLEDEYKSVIEDYFLKDSLEKRIVDAADKLDMMLQAYEYSRAGYSGAKEFFTKIDGFIDRFSDIEQIREIFVELKNGIKEETCI